MSGLSMFEQRIDQDHLTMHTETLTAIRHSLTSYSYFTTLTTVLTQSVEYVKRESEKQDCFYFVIWSCIIRFCH